MASIAICYIATGPYKVFWKDFHESFEKRFLVDTDPLQYYVFTDEPELFAEERVHTTRIDTLPWPLPTLMRFHYFLDRAENLSKADCVFFANANLHCKEEIFADEVLPRREKGERYSFTQHGSFRNALPWRFPYERNPRSTARIGRFEGKRYVMGGLFGGFSEDFLSLCELLEERIETDLSHGIIARWHDESHLNRFIVGRDDYRLLDPSYLYPVDDWAEECHWSDEPAKILVLQKDDYFPVQK